MADPEPEPGTTTTWRHDFFGCLKGAQSFREGFLNLGIAAIKVDFSGALKRYSRNKVPQQGKICEVS